MKLSHCCKLLLTIGLFSGSVSAFSQNFGSVAVGGSSQATVTVTVATAGQVGSVAVVTTGVSGLDFTNAGGGTCSAGTSYAQLSTCTVVVNFAPLAVGSRLGAVVLYDGPSGSGNILGATSLQGVGTGARVQFTPAKAVTFSPTVNGNPLDSPGGVVADAAGNVFMLDGKYARVIELPAGGGAAIEIKPVVEGLGLDYGYNALKGLAIDGVGSLYIGDVYQNRVVVVPGGGGAPYAVHPVVNGTSMVFPVDLGVDGSGNLYIADPVNHRVVEVPSNGGDATEVNSNNIGGLIAGMAVDAAGDLYFALSSQQIAELPAGGGSLRYLNPNVGTQSVHFPQGITVDATGNVYVADTFNNRIVEVAGDGSSSGFVISTDADGMALHWPFGLSVAPSGDLWVADTVNNRVVDIQRSQPGAIQFVGSGISIPSTDSPLKIRVESTGTARLLLSGITFPTDFPEQPGPGECTGTTSLDAADSCQLGISFVPTSLGLLSEFVAVTDNAGPAGSVTQQIPVMGDGLLAQTITFAPLPNIVIGATPITLAATASSGLPVSYSVAGPASVSGNELMVTAAGEVTVTASQLGNTTYGPAIPVSQSFYAVLPAHVALHSSWLAATVGYPVTLTANVSGAAGIPTGAVTFFTGSTSLGQGTLAGGTAQITTAALPAGADTLTVQYGGDAVYGAGSSAPVVEQVNSGPTIVLSATPSTTTPGVPFSVRAMIETARGEATPTGSIRFYLDGVPLGTAPIVGGQATWNFPGLQGGNHHVTTQLTSVGDYKGLRTLDLWYAVQRVAAQLTLGTVNTIPGSGGEIGLSATIAETIAGLAPGGTVNFYVDGQRFGPIAVVNGKASFTTPPGVGSGWHSFGVRYNGDNNYLGAGPQGLQLNIP